MQDNYWIYGILSFLCILSLKKYTNLDLLREWIEDYLCKISPQEVEEEDVIVLEELRDMVEDFVIRNPEIFSNINNNKDE